MIRNILVFDVESTSLHGKAFAVGAIVVDIENWKEIDKFLLKSIVSERDASPWVRENVLPHLTNIPFVQTDKELRDQFWDFYKKHKENSQIWSDVGYPVETNFLEQLYKDSPQEREFDMPYPLYDVSSHVDVDIDRNHYSRLDGLAKHNPYDDAKASAYSLLTKLAKHFH